MQMQIKSVIHAERDVLNWSPNSKSLCSDVLSMQISQPTSSFSRGIKTWGMDVNQLFWLANFCFTFFTEAAETFSLKLFNFTWGGVIRPPHKSYREAPLVTGGEMRDGVWRRGLIWAGKWLRLWKVRVITREQPSPLCFHYFSRFARRWQL